MPSDMASLSRPGQTVQTAFLAQVQRPSEFLCVLFIVSGCLAVACWVRPSDGQKQSIRG